MWHFLRHESRIINRAQLTAKVEYAQQHEALGSECQDYYYLWWIMFEQGT